MSHVESGPLAGYNSLVDPHLSGYFANTRMRRQLRKSGLISGRGEIVSESMYRLSMARKEHKKHVRDMLAQAIVHKTLDMERTRQVSIKEKLEEIAKIELVRRVRAERARRGDEEILPYLSPRASSARRSRSASAKGTRRRTRSASGGSRGGRRSVTPNSSRRLYVDEDGYPATPPSEDYENERKGRKKGRGKKKRGGYSPFPREEVDDKHLYALDQRALREYTNSMQGMANTGRLSPYLVPQIPVDMQPVPPKTSSRPGTGRRSRHGQRSQPPPGSSHGHHKGNKGSLMLHRAEPAMKHQERVQTMCEVTMHYFGSSLCLDYEKFDPRNDIIVEQQHCGGNTLLVFQEKVLPKSDFTFTSRRHRGYPFSLTMYINGVVICRISACCEYKHRNGSRLGGKQGHFGIKRIEGAAPCYRCQVNEGTKKPRKKRGVRMEGDEEEEEEQQQQVVVEREEKPRKKKEEKYDVRMEGDDDGRPHTGRGDGILVPVEDDREDAVKTWYCTVYTSDLQVAGTDANVYIMQYGKTKDGEYKQSKEITLDNKGNNFERGKVDNFTIKMVDVGTPYKLRVSHDSTGALPGWHLNKIEMEEKQSKKKKVPTATLR